MLDPHHSYTGDFEKLQAHLLALRVTLRAAYGWLSPFGRFDGARWLLCCRIIRVPQMVFKHGLGSRTRTN